MWVSRKPLSGRISPDLVCAGPVACSCASRHAALPVPSRRGGWKFHISLAASRGATEKGGQGSPEDAKNFLMSYPWRLPLQPSSSTTRFSTPGGCLSVCLSVCGRQAGSAAGRSAVPPARTSSAPGFSSRFINTLIESEAAAGRGGDAMKGRACMMLYRCFSLPCGDALNYLLGPPMDPDEDSDNSSVYVQGLNDNVTLEDLADFFKQCGVVKVRGNAGERGCPPPPARTFLVSLQPVISTSWWVSGWLDTHSRVLSCSSSVPKAPLQGLSLKSVIRLVKALTAVDLQLVGRVRRVGVVGAQRRTWWGCSWVCAHGSGRWAQQCCSGPIPVRFGVSGQQLPPVVKPEGPFLLSRGHQNETPLSQKQSRGN